MGIVYSIEVVNRYETNIANTGAMVSLPQLLGLAAACLVKSSACLLMLCCCLRHATCCQ